MVKGQESRVKGQGSRVKSQGSIVENQTDVGAGAGAGAETGTGYGMLRKWSYRRLVFAYVCHRIIRVKKDIACCPIREIAAKRKLFIFVRHNKEALRRGGGGGGGGGEGGGGGANF